MKLQNIIFPKPNICCEQEMYVRNVFMPNANGDLYFTNASEQSLSIDKKGIVYFDTYFNGFSIGKWKKYTTVAQIQLCLKLKGSFTVQLLHSQFRNGSVIQKILTEIRAEAPEQQIVSFPFPDCEPNGALSFRLESREDGSTLFGGSYETVTAPQQRRDVRIAVNICQYKREEYVYRTLDIISKWILQNKNSSLKGHLEIYIADNSSSLDMERIKDDCIHVFPQGDFGGTGGFTRGIMEVLADQKERGLTHVLMMDDDILLEPESLERTYAFLSLVKEQFVTAFLGGALLRLDSQNIQYINGGEWNLDSGYIMHKMWLNLNFLQDILFNEIEDGARINGWWYQCIPLTEVGNDNLPYPFFFHMDDVEYDLRNCKQVIHLNGICIWHEPYENKPSSHVRYYNVRNAIIAQMLHFQEWNKKKMKKFILTNIKRYFFVYQYKNANLALRGAEDVFRGTNWLISQNPEELLENIVAEGYKKQPIEELFIRLDYNQYLWAVYATENEPKRKRIFRKLMLNGYLLPAKGDKVIPMYDPAILTTYRAKKVLNYDPISERGFTTEKSYRECFKIILRYFKVCRLVDKHFEEVRQDYKEHFSSVTNVNFWRKYLEIDNVEGN